MATNEFYYTGEDEINSEEAHALKDKSLLIVSDRKLDAEEIGAINGSR